MKKILFLLVFITLICASCNKQEILVVNEETKDIISYTTSTGDESEESAEHKDESKTLTKEHPDLYNQLVKRNNSKYWDVINYEYAEKAVNESARKYWP